VLPVPVYRGGLAFGIGVNRVQSFDSRIRVRGFNSLTVAENPEFGQLFIDELSDESGDIYSWNFGAAVDIAPGVSLGGALGFLSGHYSYELELDADDFENLDLELTGFSYWDTIDSDYFGVEGKIGLLARLIDQIRLGVTIGIPLDFSVDEYWEQESLYLYDDGTDESEFDNGEFSYDISRPFRFGGGIAAYPVPGAIIAADILYTDWTQTEYSEPPSENISNEDFKNDYRDTFQLRVGGEYTIPNMGLSIRGGYLFDPLPYTPGGTNIDTDRQFITAGLGMMLEEVLLLDVTYMRGFWKESSEDDITKEDRNSNRIFLSAGYRF
jgi:long-subunit fatty acid transport protein